MTRPNGVIGTVDDGVNPLPDRFTLHEGGGGQSATYSMVSYSVNQPDDASDCLAGNCAADSLHVWEVGTTHLRTCPTQYDGHPAKGYDSWATGKQYRVHGHANPAKPLTPLADFPSGFPDQHGTWLNTTDDDAPPAFLVSSAVNPIPPYPTWGYDEVIAMATDGTLTNWRFGQTLNSGTRKYFVGANADGVVSEDGNFVSFTSDMCGAACTAAPLGYESRSAVLRCDVFIMEAK
ncbi:MAG: hypothetical protein WBW53_09630 [Terriglobales bacterium]